MTPQPGFIPHAITLGTGARRALALHCTMGFGGAWAGVEKALGHTATLVCPDMPSHGKSADWDEDSDFNETVFAASAALLRDGPMDIIGHSYGAAIALRLAVAHPELVRSLTLFEPVFFAIAQADAPETLSDHDTRAAEFFKAIQNGDRAQAARDFNRLWGSGSAWDSLPDRSRAAMTRAIHVVPDTYSFLYHDTCGLLKPRVLESVVVPTLVMRGEHSLPVNTSTNTGLARRMGNATEVMIEGAGHMAPITHPVAVASLISDLFNRS